MSRILMDFKLRELYALKHSREMSIRIKQGDQELEKDVAQEKALVDRLVKKISRYKATVPHYEEGTA